ncbi:MAG: hypothetical protein PWQ51_2050 [Methanolobus sp.]|nr:hypothetical protein [Methanolobus sp.]
MPGTLILLGMLMIVAGLALISISSIYNHQNHEKKDEYSLNQDSSYYDSLNDGDTHVPASDKTEVKGGGLIMLGPIPIIISSDSKSARTLMILAIVLMMLYFLIFAL